MEYYPSAYLKTVMEIYYFILKYATVYYEISVQLNYCYS